MNVFLYLIMFYLSELSLTHTCLGGIKSSILRGHYRDVVSELDGSLIENARQIYFYGVEDQQSPLRNRIYKSVNDLLGHARCDINQSMIFTLTQAYQINTLRIRFYDFDDRTHFFKVFITDKNLREVKIYEGSAIGLVAIRFSDQQVQQIRIYSQGNSLNGLHMSIIKVQAFYAL